MPTARMQDESFRLGYRFQRHWDTPMANAFFCGELGAGLFLVSTIYESAPGLIIGLLITGIGKPFFHLTHMGVPGKSWRAILRPDRSWTSRGLIAIVVFSGAGALHTVDVIFEGIVPYGLGVQLLAGAAALVVMTYQGFAMSHSTAIALWSTAMMPFSSLIYAMTGGAMLLLLLQGSGGNSEALQQLVFAGMALCVAILIMLLGMLHAAYHGSPGGRVSAQLLTRTLYAGWFYGAVVGAGVVLPFAVLWLAGETLIARAVAAAGCLAGFYAYRVLVFKAGVYDPVMNFDSLLGKQDS